MLPGLAKLLQTSTEAGLNDDDDLQGERVDLYGDNQPIVKDYVGFWSLIWDGLNDNIIRILIVAACVSLILGLIQEPSEGWIEGTAILVAVVLVVAVTACNDYNKDRQFRKLNESAQARTVIVTRRGKETDVSVYEVLVGDLLHIKTGDVLPADGVLVRAVNLTVNESSVTGESDTVNKAVCSEDGPSPFMLSGSQVEEGTGAMLVLAVGKHSFAGRNSDLVIQAASVETDLQLRLEGLASAIGSFGTLVAVITFLVLASYIAFNALEKGSWDDESWAQLIKAFIIAVTIIVVAVPEGLPLAVTLSLAYSVDKMKEQNNLVRHLHACEEMGACTDVCSDKTGTLTENVMAVTDMYCQGTVVSVTEPDLTADIKELIAQGVCHNSTANITTENKLSGNRTECALLTMAKDWGFEYAEIRRKEYDMQIPFSSHTKRMTTVLQMEGYYRVFSKGTPSVMVNSCAFVMRANSQIEVLSAEEKTELLDKIVDGFAGRNLRTVVLACKDVDSSSGLSPDLQPELVESDLVLLAIIGIHDPVRAGVPEAVEVLHKAGLAVRMVTGDNVKTAVSIARSIGILPKSYVKLGDSDYTVMEGPRFRKLTEGLRQAEDGSYYVVNRHVFERIVGRLRVLAAADPSDKFLLVTGLKELGKVVAVTGDGTNDAPALKQANVGFAMNISGTQLAKEASDIILLDDNFVSIVTSVMWGRNIYDSLRKFIQFQLTVNLVALTMSVLGAVVLEEPPLTAVQMLWVNLIMDTFAALALATEPPSPEILKRKPYAKSKGLVTTAMMRNIMGQFLYQMLWLSAILFYGHELFGVESGWGQEEWSEETGVHFTIFFNAFVFMQVFNEVLCRKLKTNEYNVFSGFFNNPLFLFIMVLTIAVQVLIVQFGGVWMKCAPLSLTQHTCCVLIGAGGLVFGVLLKLIPSAFFMCCRLNESPPKKDKTVVSAFRASSKRRNMTQMQSFHRDLSLA
jgi:Ca2+ transporting ATPase